MDVRADPPGTTTMLFLFALAFGGCGGGAGLALGGALRLTGTIVKGVVFVGFGLLLLWGAVSSIGELVRFHVTDDDVVMEWRRRGRVLKTERVARVDLVDVAVSDTPTSGSNSLYGVAIGTKNGDIELSDTRTVSKAFYSRKRDELAHFLDVPARPTA